MREKEKERKREQKKRRKRIKEGENSPYDELGYWYLGEFVFEGRSLERCRRTPSPSNNFEGMKVLNFVRSQLPPSERRPRDSETDPKDNLTNRRRRLCLGWCGSSLGETTQSNWNPGIPSATSSGHGPLVHGLAPRNKICRKELRVDQCSKFSKYREIRADTIVIGPRERPSQGLRSSPSYALS